VKIQPANPQPVTAMKGLDLSLLCTESEIQINPYRTQVDINSSFQAGDPLALKLELWTSEI
jgi:hypothetical protein